MALVNEAPSEAAQDAGQPQAGGQAPQGGVSAVIMQTDQNLAKLAMALSKAPGLPPGVADAMNKVREDFTSVISAITGGEKGGPQPTASATPEQGASGAVPYSPAGAR